MKKNPASIPVISSVLLSVLLIPAIANAQITSDGTFSTTVNSLDGRNFVIENGDRAGNNLFHSFREFSVPTNGSAIFNNTPNIENIFSRVTGASRSQIDGLIQSDRLQVQNRGHISTSTFGSGDAGDLTIQSQQIDIIGINSGSPFASPP
jgi:filamentous hemagglutinin family protein